MPGRQYRFEWDDNKARSYAAKHDIGFQLASTVFGDPQLLTVADLDHSSREERWFSLGIAATGVLLAVVYLWSEAESSTIKVRLISARRATATETRQYEEGL